MSDPRVFWCERRLPQSLQAEVQAVYLAPGRNGGLMLWYPALFLDSLYGAQPEWNNDAWGSEFPVGTTLSDACDEAMPDFKRSPCRRGPGEYFPRIWRPGAPAASAVYRSVVFSSVRAFDLLVKQLRDLFEATEPTPKNNDAFGHATRQLLVLAATEVESGWKAVLKANHYGGGTERFTTKDYVKLHKAMRLDSYTVRLTRCPDWPAMKPFEGWRDDKPTESLWWYDAYNATKHDREQNLEKATLKAAVHAIAAAFVMLSAQFGTPIYGGPLEAHDFTDFVIEAERIKDKEFSYVPSQDGSFTPVDCDEL